MISPSAKYHGQSVYEMSVTQLRNLAKEQPTLEKDLEDLCTRKIKEEMSAARRKAQMKTFK